MYCCNLSIPDPGPERNDHVIQIFHRTPVNQTSDGLTPTSGDPLVLEAPDTDGIGEGPRVYLSLRRFARLSDVA